MNGKKMAFIGLILLTLSLVYFVFFGGSDREKAEEVFVEGIVLEQVDDFKYEVLMDETVEIIKIESSTIDTTNLTKKDLKESNSVEKKLLIGDGISFFEQYYKPGEQMEPEIIFVQDRGDYGSKDIVKIDKDGEKKEIEKENKEKEEQEVTNNEDEKKKDINNIKKEEKEVEKKETKVEKKQESVTKKNENKPKNEKQNSNKEKEVVNNNGEQIINKFYDALSTNDKDALNNVFENKSTVDGFVSGYDEFQLKYNNIKVVETSEQGDTIMYTVHAFSKSGVTNKNVAETVVIGIPKNGNKITYYEVLDVEER